jgi:hypothetical protein
MRKSNFALRLQPSLFEELRGVAAADDVTLNQFINIAVAEKLAALRTEQYFRERAAKADIPRALKILNRIGSNEKPRAGNEVRKKPAKPRARKSPTR